MIQSICSELSGRLDLTTAWGVNILCLLVLDTELKTKLIMPLSQPSISNQSRFINQSAYTHKLTHQSHLINRFAHRHKLSQSCLRAALTDLLCDKTLVLAMAIAVLIDGKLSQICCVSNAESNWLVLQQQWQLQW